MKAILNMLTFIKNLIRYNLKIVFMNRFIWFLLASLAFYAFIIFMRIRSNSSVDEPFIYNALIFPGILFLFFPTVFGIQIDKDTRILEILFGIPDYRYKVWLVRLLMSFFLSFIFILALSWISSLGLTKIHVFEMGSQTMLPLLFIGSFSFMTSTIVKSGFGTTVILIILGVFLFILSESIENSMWNVFLNPFDMPGRLNEIVWQNTIIKNRIFLCVSTVVFILYGLFNLQKREGFMK
jgi:hypothetical protein